MSLPEDHPSFNLPTLLDSQLGWSFDNTFARDLNGLFAPWKPSAAAAPSWLALNASLATELGIDVDALRGQEGLDALSGHSLPEGANPIAQAYAGHQFGHFSPQLGDGRALLLGEVIDSKGQRRDVAFKGSGRTPFSRGGDGKAAVGPVLREYLMGEAMHALGIPTTRALAAVATGEQVYRERPLPGALLVRVASSHLRVGTFQFFAARNDQEKLRRLADHAIGRHCPELIGTEDRYLGLMRHVADQQASLIAKWMGVGFIHGVMNTDNMTVSGETIDYGPCAFMDAYSPDTVFSSIDRNGRYAYGNQPLIARWNLARLAEALLPLVHDDSDKAIELVSEVIDGFPALYRAKWLQVFSQKLGLHLGLAGGEKPSEASAAEAALVDDLLEVMSTHQMDFTLTFRCLADALTAPDGHAPRLMALVAPQGREPLLAWLKRWQEKMLNPAMNSADTAAAMRAHNPLVIPRNYRVEEALDAASERGDMAPFERLLAAVQNPYEEQDGAQDYSQAAPADHQEGYRTFCGT